MRLTTSSEQLPKVASWLSVWTKLRSRPSPPYKFYAQLQVIPLKLFLDIVSSCSAEVTRATRQTAHSTSSKPPDTKWREMSSYMFWFSKEVLLQICFAVYLVSGSLIDKPQTTVRALLFFVYYITFHFKIITWNDNILTTFRILTLPCISCLEYFWRTMTGKQCVTLKFLASLVGSFFHRRLSLALLAFAAYTAFCCLSGERARAFDHLFVQLLPSLCFWA